MITELHHVQITIPNGSEAQERVFYCGVLGLSEVRKPEALKQRGSFWLRLGDNEVHVRTEDDVNRGQTNGHLAYVVHDLSFWRATLRSESIEVMDGISIPDFRRFEFWDPFGNRVELIEQLE